MLKNLDQLKKVAKPQSESDCTKAPKFTLEDSYLNFDVSTDKQIFNQYRAFKGSQFVGVKTYYQGKPIYIEKLSIPTDEEAHFLDE